MSKKEDIITTALRLFNSHSYNSVGVDRIISESGVAKMTFYKYFPSKEKLIEECLLQRNTDLQASLNTALAKCDPADHLAQIRAIFKWYDSWFHTDDFNGCMFQKAVEEVIKIYPSTLKPATQYKVWLTALIQNLLSNLDIPNPTHLATLIVSILDGMTIQAHVNKDSVQIDEYWSRVEHLINFEKELA
ncbi:TetR/AcrR family transcriptional regulator [Acinetobacter sp. VNK23]|uniref:TetR/AcrR family transcriptional regulator n=1 Tax=Acinetobacter thutiue TaxID=2998078 RepID=UPI0025763F99|nr:TetR/AcrR family transcriptional regulator [Acinetobacter thutiue]MDM1021068.1 TetR/AcrR family transcriptional regulator [Acinetobacter thutiue]